MLPREDPPAQALDPDPASTGELELEPAEANEIFRPGLRQEQDAVPQVVREVHEEVDTAPPGTTKQDLGRYWPLFVVGGLALLLIGWLVLMNRGIEAEPMAPDPAQTTVAQPTPQATESGDPTTDPEPAPSAEPPATQAPAEPSASEQPSQEPSQEPAPPPENNQAESPEVTLEDLEAPPAQVGDRAFDRIDGDTIIYRGASDEVTVRWVGSMGDAELAAELGRVLRVGNWICAEDEPARCAGQASQGRVIVQGPGTFEDIVAWGEEFVTKWQPRTPA